MNKTVWALAAAVAVGATLTLGQPTLAKGGHGAGQHVGGRMAKEAQELGLTADQKAQIKSIIQGARAQGKAIQSSTTLTPDAKKAQIKDLRKATRKQIEAVLTPAQRQQLAQMKGSQRGPGAAPGAGQ